MILVAVMVVVVVAGVKPMQCTSGKGGARELKISEARVPGVVGGKGSFGVSPTVREHAARGGERNVKLSIGRGGVAVPVSDIDAGPQKGAIPLDGSRVFSFLRLLFFCPLVPLSFAFGVRIFWGVFFLRGQIMMADENSFIKTGRV